jgi:lysyl-tRNA synthetase class I
MALKDPMVVYTAANNLEGHCVCQMLFAEGIEATMIDNMTSAGIWQPNLLPQNQLPQIVVERADAERAAPLLAEFEERARRREQPADDWEPIMVVCEECGHATQFPASKLGAVEICPDCHAYVDVGDDCELEGWDAAGEEA